MKYLLQMGRLPELGRYEIQQTFPQGSAIQQLTDQYLMVEMAENSQIFDILEQTGGVIKAYQVMTETTEESTFQDSIVADLAADRTTDFSIFYQPHKDSLPQMKEVKKALKEHDLSGRYVTSSPGGLSASILIHHKVTEYGILKIEDTYYLAKGIWTQNIDHWTVKDIQKPNRDPEKGMLPPKLARMMVNFLSPEIKNLPSKRLYDPFCGTGTILIEASELGWSVIGSDIAQSSVNQTGENMHWFYEYTKLPPDSVLFTSDATHTSKEQTNGLVNAIVTEPFLGKQQPKPDQLPNVFKGLEKLYWGALKKWTQLLVPGGEVILITPLVMNGEKRFSLEKMIDKSRELEYSILSGPLMYSREHTIVQRAIYHLKFRS